jgi:hypothetical protein
MESRVAPGWTGRQDEIDVPGAERGPRRTVEYPDHLRLTPRRGDRCWHDLANSTNVGRGIDEAVDR